MSFTSIEHFFLLLAAWIIQIVINGLVSYHFISAAFAISSNNPAADTVEMSTFHAATVRVQ